MRGSAKTILGVGVGQAALPDTMPRRCDQQQQNAKQQQVGATKELSDAVFVRSTRRIVIRLKARLCPLTTSTASNPNHVG
jgi:hypothetical protein